MTDDALDAAEQIRTAWDTPEVRAWQARVAGLRKQVAESPGRRIHHHLDSYLRTTEVWRIFAGNLSSLLRECEHNDELMVYVMQNFRRPDPRDSVIAALDCSLVAYCAGVGAVIDQTRELVGKYGDKRLKQEFEERKRQMVQAVPSTPFVSKLRNYVLHYLSAPWGITLHWENTDAGQVQTFKVHLSREELLSMKGWASPVRQFLESQDEQIHLAPIINDFTAAEWDLVAWAHNSVQDLHQEEFDATNKLVRQLNLTLTGGTHDGSAWQEFKQHLAENIRRRDAGEEQLDWRQVKAQHDRDPGPSEAQ